MTPRPRPGVLFGVTHEMDGTPIVREPKRLKIGIGMPKGPAIHVWMEDGNWRGVTGFKSKDGPGMKAFTFKDRKECEAWYAVNKKTAPVCNFPRKLPYFTFTRQGADGTFDPDFASIEAHGSTPTEIDVIFTNDDPLDRAFQWWTKSKLRCWGDGINAMRDIELASKDVADAARKAGERYFPIVNGCWQMGCPYAGKPDGCKPNSDLKFQPINALSIGATAYFHTTGFRSLTQLFSSLEIFRRFTRGHVAGIPLVLVMRPYQTNKDGKAATQWGVSLEFRPETLAAIKTKLIDQAQIFHAMVNGSIPTALPEPTKLLTEAGAIGTVYYEEDDGAIDISEEDQAQSIHDEFYEGDTDSDKAQVATEAKTAALASKLAAVKTEARPVETPAATEPTKPPDAPTSTTEGYF